MDVESNSLYAYRECLCLLQVSLANEDYVIDPLAGFRLDGLEEILSNASIEKVFHAAEYDIGLLKREYPCEIHNIFDTMWAARILGYKKLGLANLVQEFFGVELDKRLQTANWAKRPLTPALLEYAQRDTFFLYPLRDVLANALQTSGLWTEASEHFSSLEKIPPSDNEFDPEGFWRLPGARTLRGRSLAALKALYEFRDAQARRLDRPSFKVLSKEVLVAIAKSMPRTLDQLAAVQGMNWSLVRQFGEQILEVVRRSHTAPVPAYPKRKWNETNTGVGYRLDALLEWRKQAARERGVESDVILTRDLALAIALADPQSLDALSRVDGLGPYKLRQYGERILTVLAEARLMEAQDSSTETEAPKEQI